MTDKPFLEQPDLQVKAEFRAALLTYPGNFREALRQAQEDPRKTLFGVGHGIPSTFVTKLIAATRPDFIWFDAEHAMMDRLVLNDAIHAAQAHSEGKSMVVVRVPKHDEVSVSTALDAGAAAIVFPHCESAQEVKEAIKEVYYPPLGVRSFSPWTFTPGVTNQSLYAGDAFNIKTSNEHICVVAQIESVEGVKNVEEIAALEGVSALMFGPGDYMIDAGLPLALGGKPHPTFAAAMEKFVAAGKKYGKPLFGGCHDPSLIPMMVEQGYRAICPVLDVWGFTNLVYNGVKQGRELSLQALEAAETKDLPNGKAHSS